MEERDREDVAMEALLMPSSMQISVAGHHHQQQQNLKPPLVSNKPAANYGPLQLENDESLFFDGILSSSGDHGMQNATTSTTSVSRHLAANSSSSKSQHPAAAAKRPLSSTTQFWSEVGSAPPMGNSSPAGGAATGKRFHGDLNSSSSTTGGAVGAQAQEENNSFVSLLNQIPQGSAPFHHPNSILASLGDGVLRPQYQLPSMNMNWNS